MSSSKVPPITAEGSDSSSNSVFEGSCHDIPMERDSRTFEGLQAVRLKEMEKKVVEEMSKKKQKWKREVERMREEFLELYPCDRMWGSEELLNDPLVAKRRGSTDILDKRKMRTLFLEYPDTGRRFKLRFNCREYDPVSVNVAAENDRIVIRAYKPPQGDQKEGKAYERKIQRPREVEIDKLRSFLTTDGILIIEAPVPPVSLNLRKLPYSPSHVSQASHNTQCSKGSRDSRGSSSRSRSPSNSPHTPTTHGQKHGMPHFNEDKNGIRRFSMIIDIGTCFKSQDVTVQVIKDNRIQVKAKHEERTSEFLSKNKFCKEYELQEKIEHLTLRGGLTGDGRLIIGAIAKGALDGMSKQEAGNRVLDDLTDQELKSCNVLDLATFPPVNSSVSS